MALQPVDASKSNPLSRLYRWSLAGITAVGVLTAVLAGTGKVMRYFILPACDECPVLETLSKLVAGDAEKPGSFRGSDPVHEP